MKIRINLAGLLALAMLAFSPVTFPAVDLSGTYDVATLTPLERPKAYGKNLYLSVEDAEKMRAADAAAKADRNEASNPDREAPPSGGDGSPGAAGNVGGYNTFWIDNGDQAFLVDGKFRTSILTTPADGRRPKLTPASAKRMAERRKRYRTNQGEAWWLKENMKGPGPYDDMELRPAAERCLLGFGPVAGPPMFPTLYNNLKRIVQSEDSIMILAEMVHDARVVRMNEAHRPGDIRTWLGDSIGWWEGETLVVDTTNFTDRPALNGASRNLHVVEKFRRLENGDLLYSFLVEDPTVWSSPWGGEYPWPATQDKVYEYACHEGNYSFGNIMRGARLLEQDFINEGSIGGGN